ncbi:MAG: hypothetical protein RIE08_18065 [Acidimicrobiales bacterium]
MAYEAVRGERPTSETRTAPRSAKGRVCVEEDCGTRLSIYNDLDYCAHHQPMVVQRMRGRVIDE